MAVSGAIAYVTDEDAAATLVAYGLPPLGADDIAAAVMRASRFIDGLEFVGDAERTDDSPWRYSAIGEVPGRVQAATALLAQALPADGSEVPVPRQPRAIRAGETEIEYGIARANAPAQSDDAIEAIRRGIPSVHALRLLRPFLVLLDDRQTDEDTVGEGMAHGDVIPQPDSLQGQGV